MKRIGPHSRPHVLAKLDRRTTEARLLDSVRAELTDHVGGKPSATQAVLIERAAMLSLHMALMDKKMLDAADGQGAAAMSKEDTIKYLAWSNTIAKLVKQLGPKVGPDPSLAKRTLADIKREQAGIAQ